LADEFHHNSRQAIKKYVKANNKGLTSATDAQFDVMFNKALKSGVEKGDFTQPKGASPGNDSTNNDACTCFAVPSSHSFTTLFLTDMDILRPIWTSQAREERSQANCCKGSCS
jgi:linker histone H1 and H5 family